MAQGQTHNSTTLNNFMNSTSQILTANTQAIARLETQLRQLAATVTEREKGKFPSQPEPNPRGLGPNSRPYQRGPSHVHQV